MSRRNHRPLPQALIAATFVTMLGLGACTPGDEGFEEEAPAETAADADTGAGTAIETDASHAEIGGDSPALPAASSGDSATPCDTEAVQGLIGQTGSEEIYTRAMQDSGAKQFRALGPTDMATMDFREDRLNIDLDADGRITGFRCG
ncbi:hypothetical protein LDO26_06115 [Luteimonas sp. BDR2-5]|uniref:I78 family peptidase inhibitor n=1 Tax=Proluteimonas luteida TaxID=2878685 RepID=UPI001E392A9F|nr:I78 family peptidase inhibitor [Luteimonas sp. BDR2-5]MCD9027777.1 hypothetical protein [Luteimonas sp. BDR2-5]